MKKFLLCLACAATAVFCASAAPQEVEFTKLPANSQEFIRRNFPSEKVKSVEMDREATWNKYTVYFNSGSQVSFEGGSGDCSEIIMKNGSVPSSALPANIRTYVNNSYSGKSVTGMKTTTDGYKVYLSDKTVLNFDKNGDFVNAAK